MNAAVSRTVRRRRKTEKSLSQTRDSGEPKCSSSSSSSSSSSNNRASRDAFLELRRRNFLQAFFRLFLIADSGLARMFLFRRGPIAKMNALCFQRNFVAASSPLVPVQVPSRMEAHLWYVIPDEVRSPSLLNQYLDILSPSEKEIVSSMRGEQLKKAALLARTLVRTTIARYQINGLVDPRSLKFRKNIHGKPELDCDHVDGRCASQLHFNISHTSSLIVCGVTLNSPIGVDVEEKQRKLKNDLLSFARRYFTPSEVRVLSSISDAEVQRQHFVKVWTLKESYVKALGKGFSALPFKTFTIRFGTDQKVQYPLNALNNKGRIFVESNNEIKSFAGNWQFSLLELAGSHYAAICMEENDAVEGRDHTSMKVIVRKTMPFLRDELISEPDLIVLA